MRITSSLSSKAYLASMKEQMSGHFALGQERFTGFFLGRCFYVTHHAGYEWNRRITNQKNAALGYAQKTDTGCEIRYIRFKGPLCPGQFIFLYLMCIAVFFVGMLSAGIWDGKIFGILCAIALPVIVVSALIGSFVENLTQRSEEGRRILMAFLLDPTDPFSYLNHENEVY